jgi:CRISPR system Cascade subunit CasD
MRRMPDHRWLILQLEAPLLAFGGVTIDQVGVTRDFPAVSMLTGLLANALGWQRTEWEKHQALQDRLVFAARRERESAYGILTDTQNAQLCKSDRGWTTWGMPEGRDGASYGAPHRRRRDYHMDARVIVALRLEPTDLAPDLETLAAVLDRPARPLFVGRKPCLPSAPLRQQNFVTAPTAYAALQQLPLEQDAPESPRAVWPLGEGPSSGDMVFRIVDLPDLRNWRTGLHGGARKIVEGIVTPERVSA